MKKFSVVCIFILMAAMASFAFQGAPPSGAAQPNGTAGQAQAPSQTPQQPSNPPPSSLPQSSRPQDQAPQEQAQPQQPGTPPSIDDQVKMLAADLNLNADQQTKIKTILHDQHDQGMKIAQDPSLPRDQKISKIHDLRENTISQVRATLTSDEQRQKFDAMVKPQEEKMRQMEQQERSKPESPK